MKKIQLVETGISTEKLIGGYKFFDALIRSSKPGNDNTVATTPNTAE